MGALHNILALTWAGLWVCLVAIWPSVSAAQQTDPQLLVRIEKTIAQNGLKRTDGRLGLEVSVMVTIQADPAKFVPYALLEITDPVFNQRLGSYAPATVATQADGATFLYTFFLPATLFQVNGPNRQVEASLTAISGLHDTGPNYFETPPTYSDPVLVRFELPPYQWVEVSYGLFSVAPYRADGRPWDPAAAARGENPEFCWRLAHGKAGYFTAYPHADLLEGGLWQYPEQRQALIKFFQDDQWTLEVWLAQAGSPEERIAALSLTPLLKTLPYHQNPAFGPVQNGPLTLLPADPEPSPLIAAWRIDRNQEAGNKWRIRGAWEKSPVREASSWAWEFNFRLRHKGAAYLLEEVSGKKKYGSVRDQFHGFYDEEKTHWLVDTIPLFEPDCVYIELDERYSRYEGDTTLTDGYTRRRLPMPWQQPEKDPETLAIVILVVAGLGLLWALFRKKG